MLGIFAACVCLLYSLDGDAAQRLTSSVVLDVYLQVRFAVLHYNEVHLPM